VYLKNLHGKHAAGSAAEAVEVAANRQPTIAAVAACRAKVAAMLRASSFMA
jgi:hypothetical protein